MEISPWLHWYLDLGKTKCFECNNSTWKTWNDSSLNFLKTYVNAEFRLPRLLKCLIDGEGGGVRFTSWKFSTLWKFSLIIVYIIKKTWDFSIKFWYSDQMVRRNIFTPYAQNLKDLPIRNSRFLFYTYYWQISWHGISWKLTFRILLD